MSPLARRLTLLGLVLVAAVFVRLGFWQLSRLHERRAANRAAAEARASEAAARHQIPRVYNTYQELLSDREIQIVDIAVPPDILVNVIRDVVKHHDHIRGILAQKPLGSNYAEAKEIV